MSGIAMSGIALYTKSLPVRKTANAMSLMRSIRKSFTVRRVMILAAVANQGFQEMGLALG